MKALEPIIENYSPISLEEMDRVKLMNRQDTKFVMHIDQLPSLLVRAKEYYKSIEIDNNRIFTYNTLYFDTKDYSMYNDHHRGKLNRYKIRYREYVETRSNFLEIKFKSNKERTIKSRIQREEIPDNLSEQAIEFIESHSPYKASELEAKLWSSFKRLTLVHKEYNERLTIDFNLKFYDFKNQVEIPNIVIVELKQEKFSVSSDFYKLLREEGIQPTGMSKYCTGVVLLNKNIRYNRFKPGMLNLQRVNNEFDTNFVFNRS